MQNEDLVTLTSDIAAAFVSNNNVAISDVPLLISKIHASLQGLGTNEEPAVVEVVPAVSIRASVKPDYLVCLECGKRGKTLRRHISSTHGLDEAAYREKYKLPASYPMTAPAYSEKRKELAKSLGLGTKGRGGGRKPAGRPKK
jgi:predicted transcriptional regulator